MAEIENHLELTVDDTLECLMQIDPGCYSDEDIRKLLTVDSPYRGQLSTLQLLYQTNFHIVEQQISLYLQDKNESDLHLRRNLSDIIEIIRWDIVVKDSTSEFAKAAEKAVITLFRNHLNSANDLVAANNWRDQFSDQGNFVLRFCDFATTLHSSLEREKSIINLALNEQPSLYEVDANYHQFLLSYTEMLIATLQADICDWHEDKVRTLQSFNHHSSTIQSIKNRSKNILHLLMSGMNAAYHEFHQGGCGFFLEYQDRIKRLVESCLIIENRPPQVIKVDSVHNSCKLRHILSDQLHLHTVPVEAKVQLVTERNLAMCKSAPAELQDRFISARIDPPKCKSFHHKKSNELIFEWKRLKLLELQRSENIPTVFDEKFYLVFSTSFSFSLSNECQMFAHAKVISLPIVVIKATKQQITAEGRVLWDNMFLSTTSKFEQNFPPQTPQTIPLSALMDNLDTVWRRGCQSFDHLGRGLDVKARAYLASKLTDNSDNIISVTWDKFCKDKIPGRNFTFWKYFLALLNLVSCQAVNQFWNDGLIYGFVEREGCEKILLEQEEGTFMFRFSKHLLGRDNRTDGGLTLSFKSSGNCVGHLSPYSTEELNKKSLHDIIKFVDRKHQPLKNVYPTRHPKSAFKLNRKENSSNRTDFLHYIPHDEA